MSRNVKVAAVQATPVFLDRDATIEKSCDLIAKASAEGASLVVFPEAFVPTYPDWVWRTVPWERDEWFELLWDQAVVVPSEASKRLAEAAAQHGAHVVMGINERDENGSTLYNSLLYFSPTGGLIGKHRKLMPTGGERLVWGMGDGSTLDVFPTAIGRLGGLICWENYMPLARYALYSQGIDIYVAPTWDNSEAWVPTLRHIAKEGRVFVIGVTACQRAADVPGILRGRDDVYGDEDDWMSKGNSAIVDPWGALLAGPLVGSEGIVTAELDLDSLPRARMQFDPVGHYSRADVFTFGVDRGTG